MTLECPNCRAAQRFGRRFSKEWICADCGSVLAFGKSRPILPGFRKFFVYVFAAFTLLGVVGVAYMKFLSPSQDQWIFTRCFPPLIVAYPFVRVLDKWAHRAVIVRTRAGVHCRECGYDLRGQTEARCPECGAGFDPVLLSSDAK